ncbi:MAG: MBL fold metallo-hydrolase [Clostridia bacterium]|nr:MBL fold metallo-hydrolase [Clostridia bacterium]
MAKDRDFRAWQIDPGTWCLDTLVANSFLLIGEEKAMLVDTGMSRNNLKEFVSTITDLPVFVVNTHGHFDHTGGNGFFEDVYMSAYAATEAKTVFTVGDDARSEDEYPLDYEIKIIEEGHIFDLGGRRIEVIAIPCHSPGSLAYLDLDKKILFSGDEIDPGQVLLIGYDDEPRKRLEDHLSNMEKLLARKDDIRIICPAHNGAPIVPEYIDIYADLDRRILAGEEGKKGVFSSTWTGHGHPEDPNWRRLEAPGTTAVVYDVRDYPPKQEK